MGIKFLMEQIPVQQSVIQPRIQYGVGQLFIQLTL